MTTIDLFAGIGWAEGLALLGLHEIGFELMAEACSTRIAAGHRTIRCDLTTYPVQQCSTLIASPPCQTFSAAGSGDGLAHLERLAYQAEVGDWSTAGLDDRTRHVLTPGRWIDGSGCDTVLLEQVPAVLPVWQGYARLLRARGWSAWAGVLNAADYGVPQTRRRAFLIASRLHEVIVPEPTHCDGGAVSLFGQLHPWVSMAEALGWDGELIYKRGAGLIERHGERPSRSTDQPAPTITGAALGAGGGPKMMLRERQEHGATRTVDQPAMTITGSADNGNFRWELDRRQQNADGSPVPPVPDDRPSPTLTGAAGAKGQWVWRSPAVTCDTRITARCHHEEGSQGADAKSTGQVRAGDYEGTEPIRLSIEEALILQSFRPDMPLQGTKSARFLQVGNAVPPVLAAHVAAAVLGHYLTTRIEIR